MIDINCTRYRSNKISKWRNQGIYFYDRADSIYVYNYWKDCLNCENCNKIFLTTLDKQLDHCHLIKKKANIRGVVCNKCNTRTIESCAKLIKHKDKSCKQGYIWRFKIRRDNIEIVHKSSINKKELEEFRITWIDDNLNYFTYF